MPGPTEQGIFAYRDFEQARIVLVPGNSNLRSLGSQLIEDLHNRLENRRSANGIDLTCTEDFSSGCKR